MNDILKIDAVREFYKNSFRPNDPVIQISEILDFVEYCLDFYGPGGIYDYGFTFDEICRAPTRSWDTASQLDTIANN